MTVPKVDWYTGRPIREVYSNAPSYVELEGGIKLYLDTAAFEGASLTEHEDIILSQVTVAENIATFTFSEDGEEFTKVSAPAYDVAVSDPQYGGGENFNPYFPPTDDEPAVVNDPQRTEEGPEEGWLDAQTEAKEVELDDTPEETAKETQTPPELVGNDEDDDGA